MAQIYNKSRLDQIATKTIAYNQRQLKDVAPATDPTDVVILSQLKGLTPTVTKPITVATGLGSGDSLTLIHEVPTGTINGTNPSFFLSNPPLAGWLILHLNNALQDPIENYGLVGNEIIYSTPPPNGAIHHAWYFKGVTVNTAPSPITGSARHFSSSLSGDSVSWSPGSLYTGLSADLSVGLWVNIDASLTATFPTYSIIRYGQNLGGLTLDQLFGLCVFGSAPYSIIYAHNDGTGFAGSGLQQNTFSTAIAATTWVYLGFSRDSSAKTVILYLGNGSTISPIATFTYINPPVASGTGGMVLGNFDGSSGGSDVSIQEHYIWSRVLSQSEHLAASKGMPSLSSIVLYSKMGTGNPPVDLSPNNATGSVNGTTIVPGH